MAYSLHERLVVGVASSAVFDLRESDEVFRRDGEERYRKYQEEHLDRPLEKGIAFSFIRRLLSLNDLSPDLPNDPLVEVILLSRNDPDTGMRVMRSIAHHGLAITRAIFMQGTAPHEYIPALSISLFLSGNEIDVRAAMDEGHPAGQVLDSAIVDDPSDTGLRIAFDFDGVLADDESESVMHMTQDLNKFHQHEVEKTNQPLAPGPLQKFLVRVAHIQSVEEAKRKADPTYRNRLRISLVTARNAPSHERALKTLKSWGVMPNDAFFLGGIDKSLVLGVMKPHVFFDDQSGHLKGVATVAPSVHIPFGIKNSAAPK
jgi:5'-nucleotidase